MKNTTRRFELDWLRILVFALLIIYHVSMYFNPWGWHIKNSEIYDWLQWPLLALNQWRLEILFVISGMGTYFSLRKRGNLGYSLERIKRLWLPLAFGMLVIVPPQVYIERVVNDGLTLSYWEYWTSLAFQGVYPEGNISWHHLWFLPYLLCYALLLIPLRKLFPKKRFQRIGTSLAQKVERNPWLLFWCLLPIMAIDATLSPFFPVEPKLIGDWYAFTHYFLLFILGFAFMHFSDVFFAACAKIRRKTLLLAALAFGGQLLCLPHMAIMTWADILQSVLEIVYLWSIILAIFGYATTYLAHKNKYLPYMNEAVYPFYIFHQTTLLLIIYYFRSYFHSDALLFGFLLLATFLGSWLLYELVRRINFIRPFVGLKGKFRTKRYEEIVLSKEIAMAE